MGRPRQKITLESLADLHTRCDTRGAKEQIRRRARELARYTQVPIPPWAEAQRAYRPKGGRVQPMGADQSVFRNDAARGELIVPVVVPDELRAWRTRTAGAIVRISTRGVDLVTCDETRTFPTVEAAIAAVTCS
jgi:hypothetical protein